MKHNGFPGKRVKPTSPRRVIMLTACSTSAGLSDKMCVLVPAAEAAREPSWEARDWGAGQHYLGACHGR